MNVTQRPGAIEFASNMPDYIIDADATISFEVKLGNQTILSEEYSPDAEFKIRIRRLGLFCRKALWGIWPGDGNVTTLDNVADTFSFYINGEKDCDTFVIFSRVRTSKTTDIPVVLSSIFEKVTRKGIPEFASFFVKQDQILELVAVNSDGVSYRQDFYTHLYGNNVCTFRTDADYISDLIGIENIRSYNIAGMQYYVDATSYTEKYVFRFKNIFDCTEIICATGYLQLKSDDNSETSYMYGVERKFVVNRNDEYTVNSGVIFKQSDYRLWHDFLNCQEASILIDGTWYDIVITQQNFERDYRKNILKAVEFSFRLADPENSGVI